MSSLEKSNQTKEADAAALTARHRLSEEGTEINQERRSASAKLHLRRTTGSSESPDTAFIPVPTPRPKDLDAPSKGKDKPDDTDGITRLTTDDSQTKTVCGKIAGWPADPPKKDDDRPRGVDLSFRNGEVDMPKLKEAGIGFAMIKASDGATFSDPSFADFWKASSDAKLPHGAYHFFRVKKPIDEQVNNFLSNYSSVTAGQLPMALDVENPPSSNQFKGMKPDEVASKALEWLEKIEAKTGQRPMIYSNYSIIKDVLGNDPRLARYPLWLAQPQPNKLQTPTVYDERTLWQYAVQKFPGVAHGKVDLNVYCGNTKQFAEFLKSNAPKPTNTDNSDKP